MTEMRKITVSLPADLLEATLAGSGKGLTETLREALEDYRHKRATEKFLSLRGRSSSRSATSSSRARTTIADAIDTSVVIGWFNGFEHPATEHLLELVRARQACLAPAAVTEIWSDPNAAEDFDEALGAFRVLQLAPGYWERAGLLRAAVFRAARKVALGDALIAQACLDADVPLLARDKDFRVFAEVGGLKLA